MVVAGYPRRSSGGQHAIGTLHVGSRTLKLYPGLKFIKVMERERILNGSKGRRYKGARL